MADLLLNMPYTYEPKRKNRFIFRFPTELGIAEWYVQSAGRPSLSQSEVEIPFLNTKTWVIGRFEWNGLDYILSQLQVDKDTLLDTKKYVIWKCWIQLELLLKNGNFKELC